MIELGMKKFEGSKSIKPYLTLKSFHKLPDGFRLKQLLDSPKGEKKKRAMMRECVGKKRYATLEEALKVAKKFGQRVRKCYHCSGGFHCTSKEELKTTADFVKNRKQRRKQ